MQGLVGQMFEVVDLKRRRARMRPLPPQMVEVERRLQQEIDPLQARVDDLAEASRELSVQAQLERDPAKSATLKEQSDEHAEASRTLGHQTGALKRALQSLRAERLDLEQDLAQVEKRLDDLNYTKPALFVVYSGFDMVPNDWGNLALGVMLGILVDLPYRFVRRFAGISYVSVQPGDSLRSHIVQHPGEHATPRAQVMLRVDPYDCTEPEFAERVKVAIIHQIGEVLFRFAMIDSWRTHWLETHGTVGIFKECFHTYYTQPEGDARAVLGEAQYDFVHAAFRRWYGPSGVRTPRPW